MNANRSSAVMQQRVEAHDSLDDFPTPPWATRALCELLIAEGEQLHMQSVWEPACNRGYMARPLAQYFDRLQATDVHHYGWSGQQAVADFLVGWAQDAEPVDWVITNPPFRLADDFVRRGLEVARRGVAVFVRTAFVEGKTRYRSLFEPHPEWIVAPLVERAVLWQGVLLDPDVSIWRAGKDGAPGHSERPTTATSYAWLIWRNDYPRPTKLCRIAPCRARLTQPGDYPPVPDDLRPPVEPGALL